MTNEAGLRLTGIRVLVCPEKVKPQTKSGIVLVDDTIEAEERAGTRGVLVDAAKQAWSVKEMDGVKIGDMVFFAKYAGDAVHFSRDGRLYRVMNATDVIGVVEAQFDSQFEAARTTGETFGHVKEIAG